MTEGYAEFFATAEFRTMDRSSIGLSRHITGDVARLLDSLPLSHMLGGTLRIRIELGREQV